MECMAAFGLLASCYGLTVIFLSLASMRQAKRIQRLEATLDEHGIYY